MTLVLALDVQERLQTVAAWRGQSPEEALADLVDQALKAAEAEIGAALQASQDEFGAGGGLTLEELDARLAARRAVKHQARQAA